MAEDRTGRSRIIGATGTRLVAEADGTSLTRVNVEKKQPLRLHNIQPDVELS
jgi:hypothetical protein